MRGANPGRAFLVLSCPVTCADGSVGMLRGTADGLQLQYCATLWRAWVSYLTQVALLRASADISFDLAVIDGARDLSALMAAAEHEYTRRGMPFPHCHQTSAGRGSARKPVSQKSPAQVPTTAGASTQGAFFW